MKSLWPLLNFLSLLVIIVTFSLVNKHPIVFGKHNKGGGHHVKPGEPKSETNYEITIINQASGADAMNVACNPGGGPPGLPPPATCGPPVEPHLLKQGERFSWSFDYPDANADISYTCKVDWTGHNQGLVSLFDKDTYTDADCRSDEGNKCYWTIAPDGFYFSNEDAPFPGPTWTFRWPWGT